MSRTVFQFFLWLISKLPRRTAYALGRGLGWFYGNILRVRRAEILDRLEVSFPEKSLEECKAIRAGMYRHMGMTVIDSFRMLRLSEEEIKQEVRFVDEHNLRVPFAEGRGVVAPSGHIGSWEVIAVVGPLTGYPEAVVVKNIRPPALDELVNRVRSRFGTQVFKRKGSYRSCLRALKSGKLLGFIMDQNTIIDQGVFVSFFGRQACTTPGAVILAQQANAPIVPVFSIRRPDYYTEILCLPPIDPPPDRSPESIQRCLQEVTTAIESVIRRYPEQWIWMHRRWKTRPPEEGGGP